jgi:hypothetical protein
MSNNGNHDEEAAADNEKAQCRRNRRPSVQFIDKSLIRRRSSENEKQSLTQSKRLLPINSNCENISNDLDYLQQYSENLFLKKKKPQKRK